MKASKTAKLQERLNTEKRPAILEQIKTELALRENTPTPETPNVIETPEAIQTKPNQAPQEASAPAATETPAVTPVVAQEPRTEAQQKQIAKLQKEIEIYDAFMKCLKGK